MRFRLPRGSAAPLLVAAATLLWTTDGSAQAPRAPAADLQPTAATLPQRTVSVSMPTATRSIRVRRGGNLQAAIDSARRGDEIVLADGATFAPVKLRRKPTRGWIIIRSETAPSAPGVRVTPAAAAASAKIVSTANAESAIVADAGASGYWISGIEVATTSTVTAMYALVSIAPEPKAAADIPSDIVLDRMYVHGHPALEMQRCVRFDASNAAIIDSWIASCHIRGFDSQAVLVITSPGPQLFRNNYLEGAGENLMLGGAPPSVAGVFPEDVEIVGNHFAKPLSWRIAGWTVKNLLEVKFGRRIDIRDNYFENNWVQAQAGTAILLRNADQGMAAWVRTSDLVFRRNIVANSPHGLSIVEDPGIQMARVSIIGNLFREMGMTALGAAGGGRHLQLLGRIADIEIRQNTFLFGTSGATGNSALMLDGTGSERITIVNNIFDGGQYGVIRSGSGPGIGSLTAWATAPVFKGNAIAVPSGGEYGTSNMVLSSPAALGVFLTSGGELLMSASSPLRNAGTYGITPGVPPGTLAAALAARVVMRSAVR